jgi:hypothetical protein
VFGYFFNEWIYKHYQSKNNIDRKPRTNDELGRTASENSSLQVPDALVSFSSAHDEQQEVSSSSSSTPAWRPEYRLHGVWIPIASLAGGLVTYGLTLNFQKSWLGLAFGWIMVNLGMLGSTVYVSLPPPFFISYQHSHTNVVVNEQSDNCLRPRKIPLPLHHRQRNNQHVAHLRRVLGGLFPG